MKDITFSLQFKEEENENIIECLYKITNEKLAGKIKDIRWGTFSINEIEKQEMRIGQMSELCNKLSLENTKLRIENKRLNEKLSSIAECFISTSTKDDIEMAAAGKEIKEILSEK